MTEWAGGMSRPKASVTDAQATQMGDFVGSIWSAASGAGSVEAAVEAIMASADRGGSESALHTRALVQSLVVPRREHFAGETRLVEAVMLQPLVGKRLFLVLPEGWDAALT